MPRIVVSIAAPHQRPLPGKGPAEPVLPAWTLALILGVLVIVCVSIVMTGWLLMAQAARDAGKLTSTPTAGPELQAAPRYVPVPDPAPRMLMPVVDAEPTLHALATPFRESKPIEAPQVSRPQLIEPVEIPKTEKPRLDYSVRRLALPDAPKPLRLAIAPVAHDDVAKVMRELGAGYRFTTLTKANLLSSAILNKYDVLFLTCADLYQQDLAAAGPLRKFVEEGGTLYASDLQCDLVLQAFPEFRSRRLLPGIPQQVDARVVDAGLASHLGRAVIPLTFDAPDWRPAAFDPDKVTVCLQGIYRNNVGKSVVAPLLVRFRVKEGTVIFTSFHHSKNDSTLVRKLIDYLVFASVNARSEARVHDLMAAHGFTPRDLRPVVIAPEEPAQGEWEHRGGGVQIALGFEHIGAKLKLTLRSPKGQLIEHKDEGIFLIELADAEPGSWRYTVTPIEVPQARFPLIVAVGQLKP